jgi:hypothetical protein
MPVGKKNEKRPVTPPCMIFVDKEGAWFHKGTPIIHKGFLQLFYDSLRLDEDGYYIIRFKDQACRIDVEDTPFVVVRIDFFPAKRGDRDRFILHLIDGRQEEMDPTTLFVGPDNVLYCRIQNGVYKARFSRPGYYQIAEYIKEETTTGRFYLPLNERHYFIDEDSDKHDAEKNKQ